MLAFIFPLYQPINLSVPLPTQYIPNNGSSSQIHVRIKKYILHLLKQALVKNILLNIFL